MGTLEELGEQERKIILKKWEGLGISNDFLFGKVMQNPELCKELLQRILPDLNIERIEYIELQKSMKEGAEERGVRLDVYVKDDKNVIYNIEMQASDTRELPKRSRFYQGMIDIQLLKAGKGSYRRLNKSYIIFICTFDIYKKGRHKYTFENICKEDNSIAMGDEATKIFLNSDSDMDDVGEGLRAFLDYMKGIRTSNDKFIDQLEEAVREAKANGKWRDDYMRIEMREREIMEQGLERGLEQGLEQGRIEGTVSTLKKLNMPIQKILDMLEEEYGLTLDVAKKYV